VLDSIDVFALTCNPGDFSPSEIRTQMTQDLSGADFFSETVITQDSVKGDDAQSLDEKLSIAPSIYSFGEKSLLISIASLILVSMLFIVSRLPFLRGFQSLGRRLVSSGLIALFFAVVFRFILPNLTKSSSGNSGDISGLATNIIERIGFRLDEVAIIGFGILTFIGTVIIVIDHYLRKTDRFKLKTHSDTRKGEEKPDSADQSKSTSPTSSKKEPKQSDPDRSKD